MTSTPYEIQGIYMDGRWVVGRVGNLARCLLIARNFRSHEILGGGRVISRHIADQAEWDRHLERQLVNHKQKRASKHGSRRSG